MASESITLPDRGTCRHCEVGEAERRRELSQLPLAFEQSYRRAGVFRMQARVPVATWLTKSLLRRRERQVGTYTALPALLQSPRQLQLSKAALKQLRSRHIFGQGQNYEPRDYT